MAHVDLREASAMLAQTPRTLRSLLVDLPEAWLSANEGAGTWSARDVIAHLADLEASAWMGRVQTVLRDGARTAFAPLDRTAFRRNLAELSSAELLDLFAERRANSLDALSALHLEPAQLQAEGLHPDFGVVTLQQLLATWVVHDLTHMSQIVRVMAKRYEAAVGPWRAFLSVLTR